MKISEIRRQNLVRLIEVNFDNNQTDLANKTGKKQSQISDMVRGVKSFGEKVARDLENRLDLPPYWLDSLDNIESNTIFSENSLTPPIAEQQPTSKFISPHLNLEEIAEQVKAQGHEHVLALIKLLADNSKLKK